MAKSDKPLTKEALASMQVVDSKGRLVGKVKDVAFVVGHMGISLYVEGEDGETQCIQWEYVQAAADFILLKPEFQGSQGACTQEEAAVTKEEQPIQAVPTEEKKPSMQPTCPSCGKPLTWIPQYSRWYCYNEKKYVNPSESTSKDEAKKAKQADSKPASQMCPSCGKPLTWIPQYNRWYCYNEKKYV